MADEYKVLVVDDSTALRMVIKKVLRETDINFTEILEAANGKEALEVLDKSEVDLIFSDINMPEMNGLDFIQGMRDKNIDTPVVVISTDGSQDTVIQAIKLGAKGYIKKPFSADKLKTVFDKIF